MDQRTENVKPSRSASEREHVEPSTFSVWLPVCHHRAVYPRTACHRVRLSFRLALVCPRKGWVTACRQVHAPYAYASGARTVQLYYKWGTSRRTIIEANASASRASIFQENRKVIAPCRQNLMKRGRRLLLPCSDPLLYPGFCSRSQILSAINTAGQKCIGAYAGNAWIQSLSCSTSPDSTFRH
jgi:hypothetical protein